MQSHLGLFALPVDFTSWNAVLLPSNVFNLYLDLLSFSGFSLERSTISTGMVCRLCVIGFLKAWKFTWSVHFSCWFQESDHHLNPFRCSQVMSLFVWIGELNCLHFFTSFGWLFLSFCQLILLFDYFWLLWIWCPELFDSWILDLGCSPQPSGPSRCHSYRHSSISNDVPQSNTGISHSTLRFKMSSFNKSILWKFLPLDRQCLNGQSNSRCGNYLSPFLTESILYRTFGNLYALTQLTFTLAYPLNFFFVGFVFEWYSNDYFASL